MLEDLGELRIIVGNVEFRKSKISDLKNLEYVGGDLSTFGSDNKVTNLGKLKYVGGFFYADEELKSLSNLEYVGGDLFIALNINKRKLEDLGKLRIVRGSLDLHGVSHLRSLNNLEYVGGYFDVSNSKIASLGKVEYIGGGLFLKGSTIKDLGNLKYVGGRIVLDEEQAKLFADKIRYDEASDSYFFNNDTNYIYSGIDDYKTDFIEALEEENSF